jgi:hypothetical protein
MGAEKLGLGRSAVVLGSQTNNMLNSKKDNKGVKDYRASIWDSEADQQAIRNGYYHNLRAPILDPDKIRMGY